MKEAEILETNQRQINRLQELERERNIAVEECQNIRTMHNLKLNESAEEYNSKMVRMDVQLNNTIKQMEVSEKRANTILVAQD